MRRGRIVVAKRRHACYRPGMIERYWRFLWIAPMLLCACASRPPAASIDEPAVVYAQAGEEAVDEIRAEAAELDLTGVDPALDEVVCEREQKTGTHMRRTRCMSRRDRAAMRESSQDWIRSGGLEGGPVVTR